MELSRTSTLSDVFDISATKAVQTLALTNLPGIFLKKLKVLSSTSWKILNVTIFTLNAPPPPPTKEKNNNTEDTFVLFVFQSVIYYKHVDFDDYIYVK